MASRRREPKELTSGKQGEEPKELTSGGWGKLPEYQISGNEENEAKGANQWQFGGSQRTESVAMSGMKPKNRISGS